jgi:Tol biopolymer transport system component
MSDSDTDRLESWKEIAVFIGRDERTAMRWEEKGMPVRRDPGKRVYGSRAEIRRWIVRHPETALNDEEAGGNKGFRDSITKVESEISNRRSRERDDAPPTNPGRRRILWAAGTIFAILVVALLGVWGVRVLVVRSHASASLSAGRFVQLTDDGHNKHNLRTDGRTLYFNEIQGIRQVLMFTTTHGGPIREIDTPFSNVWLHDVSHDGKNLLVTSFEGIEPEQPLWTIPTQGGMPQRVGTTTCSSARWSPNDGEIACTSQDRIVLFDLDGTNIRTLGSFPSPPRNLTWSPDGTRLRFVLSEPASLIGSPWELILEKDSRTTASAAHRLTLAYDCCNDWGWTLDGKSFAFTTRIDPKKPGVFVLPQDEQVSDPLSRQLEVPVGIGRVDSLAPGRVGREIYLLIGSAWRGELVKLDPKRNTLETFLNGMSACYISYSRDGQWIAYVNSVDGSLWRSRADGTDAHLLTPPSFDVELPSWSPDGKQVAFTARKPGKLWRIYLVGRDGGDLKEASTGDNNQGAPTWSPDGKSIVYANIECRDSRVCGVHRLDLDSGKLEMVPGSGGFRTARWSPDGKYIAALQVEKHELMLYEFSTGRWKKLADSVTGDDINWSNDSRYAYVDSPQAEKPIIERIRVADGKRATVGNLSLLQPLGGAASMWFGVTPNGSLILLHFVNTTEVYALEGTN